MIGDVAGGNTPDTVASPASLSEKKAPRRTFKSADSSLGCETSNGMHINDDIID